MLIQLTNNKRVNTCVNLLFSHLNTPLESVLTTPFKMNHECLDFQVRPTGIPMGLLGKVLRCDK